MNETGGIKSARFVFLKTFFIFLLDKILRRFLGANSNPMRVSVEGRRPGRIACPRNGRKRNSEAAFSKRPRIAANSIIGCSRNTG